MAGGSGAGDRSLQDTPTWAVAIVCAVFVVVSILMEHGIHSLGKWFQKRHKKAMSEALEKIKAELMILGFISLLLTFGTRFISKICIPTKYEDIMLPCNVNYGGNKNGGKGRGGGDGAGDGDNDRRRKLLSFAGNAVYRRALAAAAGDDYCSAQGKVPLISQTGVHQLHIFIFVLAVFHVHYSIITIALGQAKMSKWKSWELETSSLEYQFTNGNSWALVNLIYIVAYQWPDIGPNGFINCSSSYGKLNSGFTVLPQSNFADPSRFRLAHQTSFVKRHSGISTAPVIKWIVAFFRQFFGSVSKVDYLTMRNGFINAHFAPNSKFDFHKYIKRCMEDDFKVVVGISVPLWICAIIFLLLNVYEWYTLTWLTVVPLIILLLVGTKLELVIIELAQEIQERSTVVRGTPVVEPSNKFFWFNRPQWILFLIHYTLFQNAFQMAFFLWTWYEFGLKSCFHENLPAIFARVFLGVALQFLCSYITFPLYSLVTQMGSHMKRAIFEEQTAKALKKWQKAAKERKKLRKAGELGSSRGFTSGENTPSQGTSPIHLLHKYKYHSSDLADTDSVLYSPRSNYSSYISDTELSEMEGSSHDRHEDRKLDGQAQDDTHNTDFSFVKP